MANTLSRRSGPLKRKEMPCLQNDFKKICTFPGIWEQPPKYSADFFFHGADEGSSEPSRKLVGNHLNLGHTCIYGFPIILGATVLLVIEIVR
jgi:hypothetical protein